MAALLRLFDDKSITKVPYNAKFDLAMTEKCLQRDLSDTPFHDAYIEYHILRPDDRQQGGLKRLAYDLAGFPMDDESALKPYLRDGLTYQDAPEHLLTPYQLNDAERGMLIHLFAWPRIKAVHSWLEHYNVERELVFPTLRMEQRGIQVSRPACLKLIDQLRHDSASAKMQFISLAKQISGRDISPRADADVAWLLFTKLGMPVLKRTKTKAPSTDKDDVLLPLRESHPHPILDLLLQYRSWSRGTTMIAGYLDCCDGDDVIHTSINTCGAVTDRESSSNPNLVNLSKAVVLNNPFPVPARRCFVPRFGYVHLFFDFAGIEMRLLVHYSGDEIMVKEFLEGDPHVLAAKVFYPAFDEMEMTLYQNTMAVIKAGYAAGDVRTQKMLRTAAKNCNFAIPYGGGINKTAHVLQLPVPLARKRFEMYHRLLPNLCDLGKTIGRQVTECGYVDTTFGRRLNVPQNKPYMGTNYLIQGTAAGVFKRAQVRVAKYLREATGNEVQILLPIHDELIVEYPRSRMADMPLVCREVCELMSDFGDLFKVPMAVEVGITTTDWASKKEYKGHVEA
jgi:DNA polymerase-1